MSSIIFLQSLLKQPQKCGSSLTISAIVFLLFLFQVDGFCGDSIKWSHNFNIEDVYGMWYGIGYAQHTPDMTNKPNEVGCVALHIADATTESHDDWLDWSIIKKNYADQNWRSHNSNPWSDTSLSGSWLDIRIKRTTKRNSFKENDSNRDISKENMAKTDFSTDRKAKRDIYNERRIRVMWDEDGQTMEQIYLYTPEEPGLWVADTRRMLEREMKARGIDVWYPDEPPKHPQVIRILKVTPQTLTINHCSDQGNSGIFSLILRRSPIKMKWWQWYDVKKQFFNFDLPNIYRYTAICSGCVEKSSLVIVMLCAAVWKLIL